MSANTYITLQSIRAEAGMNNRVFGRPDDISGATDGTNRDFYTGNTPIVDTNKDDQVTDLDVVAYVNGSAVSVDEVDARTGLVRFTTAPANGTEVTIDYTWSHLTDSLLEELREEAVDWLHTRVKAVYDLTQVTDDDFPREWRRILKLYCAAMIIIRNYGSSTDTDESSKDGYKKLKTAEGLLNGWIAEITGTSPEDGGKTPQTASTTTDGNIFRRKKFSDRAEGCNPELEFHNKRC